jgi:cytidylate kinase
MLEERMTLSGPPLSRYAEALDRAQRHWQTRRRQSAAPGEPAAALTVALEREAGTPGTSVAQEVGRRLGWPVYDHEILELLANEMGLRVSLLESVDERHQTWLQEAFKSFAAVPQVRENTYVRHLMEAMLSLSTHGQCVLVGRGAAQVLRPETTLRVRLVGLLQDRIAGASARRGTSWEEAAQWVENTDRDRTLFVQVHFLRDPADPRHYDLTLNSSRWSVAECADLILEALRRMESRPAALQAQAAAR